MSIKAYDQLTLGQLIEKLEQVANMSMVAETTLKFDFAGLHPCDVGSYRGFYEDLAIEFSTEWYPLMEFICDLKTASESTYTGWKGGEFKMSEDTPVWVAPYGLSSGTYITDVVLVDGHTAVMLTKQHMEYI